MSTYLQQQQEKSLMSMCVAMRARDDDCIPVRLRAAEFAIRVDHHQSVCCFCYPFYLNAAAAAIVVCCVCVCVCCSDSVWTLDIIFAWDQLE